MKHILPGLWIRIRIGSGSGLDPDWIRIRIGSGCNDLCGSGSGSMGKKNEEKNALKFLNFLNIFLAKR
jgi:hypothetical protein